MFVSFSTIVGRNIEEIRNFNFVGTVDIVLVHITPMYNLNNLYPILKNFFFARERSECKAF